MPRESVILSAPAHAESMILSGHAPVLRVSYSQWAVLRVSYSQQAALRVWCSQHLLRVSYSQRAVLRVWCSQHEGTLARWQYHTLSRRCWEYILSEGSTESMMLSEWSYSQRAALRVWCSQRTLRASDSHSQRRPLRVWYSQHALSQCITLRVWWWKFDTLRAVWSCYYANSCGYKTNNSRQYWQLPINNFGQQCLNSTANWSAAKGGRVLPHFKHIVSGASMPPCPIAAVF